MRFTNLYEELKFSDIFSAASPEEAEERHVKYADIEAERILTDVMKTKLPDGSWHVKDTLILYDIGLTTLKHLNVSIVDGYFDCDHNKLTNLIGAPKRVSGTFSCSYNENLISLEGAPKEIGNAFICTGCKLTSLKFGPIEVDTVYKCNDNLLTSLEGAPKVVHDIFDCSINRLTSLVGAPEIVHGAFYGSHNYFQSLEGIPKKIDGSFYCGFTRGKTFTEDEVRSLCQIGGSVNV